MIEIERKISQFTSCGNLDIKCCENCVNYVSGLCILNNVAVVDEYSDFDCDEWQLSRRKTIKKRKKTIGGLYYNENFS